MKNLIYILLCITFLISCNKETNSNQERAREQFSQYLGQTPPKVTPIPFAPGMVTSSEYEYGGTFSADMKEFYYISASDQYEKAKLVMFHYTNNEWKDSIISDRSGQPVLSPDGKRMYLGRRYKERKSKGWSEIKELGEPFEDQLIMRLSAANSGTLYFDTYVPEQPDFPIRYARLINGKYENPQVLSKNINTALKNINHPFIAPDESYLLWDAVREEGYGSSDIYISFKQDDGSWGEAINLGDKINTDAWEASASVTPDGKYLFFSRNMGSDNYENVDIFWVDAKILYDFNTGKQK
ncbi:TolB-like translocation protein [Marivirga arenosa]|uniref:WD40 repeat protein n=1 Tax=Marivirga arenosa TaxID=3059076 RepID=A0AA49GEI7_9BACT|nr:hypothetical protein [Marivirga sp. BKB1-2]WKK80711.2 hypothetical protein QYS47_27070 [Marivirga sp. BKB1-2]